MVRLTGLGLTFRSRSSSSEDTLQTLGHTSLTEGADQPLLPFRKDAASCLKGYSVSRWTDHRQWTTAMDTLKGLLPHASSFSSTQSYA